MDITLVAVGVASLLVAFGIPMRCRAPIARQPHRGCFRQVYGLLGRCRDHGLHPGPRLLGLIGGRHLPDRRVCSTCGRPTVFRRGTQTGKPFLGCSGYPDCKRTAGFCWPWSDARAGVLVRDVVIGDWGRPWDVKGDRSVGDAQRAVGVP